jgi:hypothetical protein
MREHPLEDRACQETDVLGEHAEHQPVDEVGYLGGVVAALTEPLREADELLGGLLGENLPCLGGALFLRVEECLLEALAVGCVDEVLKSKLVDALDGVRPVRVQPDSVDV